MAEENTQEVDLIEKANQAAERLEKANKAQEELIKKMEEAEKKTEARRILGGQSSAGSQAKPEPTEKERIAAELKNTFKGSAMEKYL